MTTLFTIGYNAWATSDRMTRLTQALLGADVTILVDIRHSPCPSDPTGRSMYGPKPWTLQEGSGLKAELEAIGIQYAWLSELGNPQKNDPHMSILRWHLKDEEGAWPVHRGLAQLGELMKKGKKCCLLCACNKYEGCHRRLVAEAYRELHQGSPIRIVNLTARGPTVVEGSV